MNRQQFLKAIGIGGCGLLLAVSHQGRAAEPGKRPNVIIILADDLGCGDMSLYNGSIKTPRIDRMAREGVRFTDFHSNSWHLGDEPRHNPIHHGFDEFVGFLPGGGDYHKHREPKLGTAMRDGHWKMLTKVDVVELYDLSNDIKETTNNADKYPQRAEAMQAAIEKWKLEVTPGTTSLLLSLSAVPGAADAAPEKPNILWISCEDTRPDLGCYGDRFATTPNLDKFAAEGCRFDRAYVTFPVCAPSRSSIITGVHPGTLGTHQMRTGMKNYEAVPPPEVKCFTDYLRAAGYYCSNARRFRHENHRPAHRMFLV